MARQRPTSLLVYGIVNIAFGCLFLICNTCSCAGLGFNLATKDSPPPPPRGSFDGAAMQRHIENTAPVYLPVMWGQTCFALMLNIVLIASGIGLLASSQLGRWGTVGYCALVLLFELGTAGYQLGFVNPAANEYFRQSGPHRPGEKEGFTIGLALNSVGGPCFVGTFALVMLTLMVLPATGKAFATDEDEDRDRRWEDDDGFERERRRYSEW